MSRVGSVYLFKRCFAVVTAGLGPVTEPGRPVYTLAVIHDSGAVRWPVERLEDCLIAWEADGRLA